ncbi:hypothetical protein CHS0354_000701 [Potamilus streckersoni]|uniref:Protein BatD n=1 Tax=Potamilus streckersoni TaxID=2493646 RepID=A0AAE0T851_9BIVA|nr:hypothetical protein CHS0354_000701 [Potamilus streckersoni]
MDAFEVLPGPSATSQNFSFVNGKLSQSKTLTYFLVPKKEGNQVIAGATVQIGGQMYKTNAITMSVQKTGTSTAQGKGGAGQKPQDEQPLVTDKETFIKPTVEKRNLYVGEGATVTYKLYSRINILRYEQQDYIKPEGFWVESFDLGNNISMGTEYLNGVVYRVAVINKIRVYPTKAGKLTISPYNAVIEALESDVRRSQGYLFNDLQAFFGLGGKTLKIKIPCPEVNFNVKPLPTPTPKSFSGAVGKFTFRAELDKKELLAGEYATIKMNINGEGNIRTIGNTNLELPNDFGKRDPIVKQSTEKSGNTIFGKISEDVVIETKTPGDFNLGKITFTYFDPESKKYVDLMSDELKLVVKENPNIANVSTLTDKRRIEKLGSDIRFIKTNVTTLQKDSPTPFYESLVFYLMLGFPYLAFFAAWVWQKRDEKFATDGVFKRAYFASPEAKKRLKEASKHLKNNQHKEFFASLELAVLKYIGDKFNVDSMAMTKDAIQLFLQNKKVAQTTIAHCLELLQTSEMFRYAPSYKSNTDLEKMFKNAEMVISEISKIS